MKNYEKLVSVLTFCEDNLSGSASEFAASLKRYFIANGQLTEKQMVGLSNLVHQVEYQFEKVAEFEALLGRFMNQTATKNILKLA